MGAWTCRMATGGAMSSGAASAGAEVAGALSAGGALRLRGGERTTQVQKPGRQKSQFVERLACLGARTIDQIDDAGKAGDGGVPIFPIERALGVRVRLTSDLGQQLLARAGEDFLDPRRHIHRARRISRVGDDDRLDRLLGLGNPPERDQAERPILLDFDRGVTPLQARQHGKCVLIRRRGIEVLRALERVLPACGPLRASPPGLRTREFDGCSPLLLP